MCLISVWLTQTYRILFLENPMKEEKLNMPGAVFTAALSNLSCNLILTVG